MKQTCLVVLLLVVAQTVTAVTVSGLNSRQFKKYWRVESEAADSRVTFRGDTCDIVSPKGLTLWRREKLQADVTVEYDAQVVDEGQPGDRLSDMNVFWLASDPNAKDLWTRANWRSGIFLRCYTLQMYYLGYGGNYNKTTRFRRYDGDEAGVEDATRRPAILKEYTDAAHLLKANHWYHWRITTSQGRTRMYVDGALIVDYLDPQPISSGWFGFRTTLSHTRITNFKVTQLPACSYQTTGVPLHWVTNTSLGEDDSVNCPVSFGVPFAQGELKDVSLLALSDGSATDNWVNATWPDGSVKWAGMAAVVPAGKADLLVVKGAKGKKGKTSDRPMLAREEDGRIIVNTGRLEAYLPKRGDCLMDSLCLDGQRVGGRAVLIASTTEDDFTMRLTKVAIERQGTVRTVIKAEGMHRSNQGREWLPFTVRLYFFAGSEQIKLVHSFVYDGQQERDFIRSLGIRLQVPMREKVYNRHVAFATDGGGVWHEPVQLLDQGNDHSALRAGQMRGEPLTDSLLARRQPLLRDWAQWDGFRLSQLTDNAFTVRKRATEISPWMGTLTGMRATGFAFVGDTKGGVVVGMKDFWQSYPSSIEVNKARSREAELTMWLWSPEAEPMNLCHYDTVAHGLRASYEDVQEGMSTPYGIARTNTLWIVPTDKAPDNQTLAATAQQLQADAQLLPTPEYLHAKRAFGIWSLKTPDSELKQDTEAARNALAVEQRLELYLKVYQKAIEQHKWYGFWNYGDVMHAYDPERHSWRYDVGGYAWDNTELGTPMWLWYNFLRTGRADIFRMAEAMTRHCSEVDVYHIGPFAPLGSRHNVSHWGCGAKEARISQAAFNRFYYYLTTDERTGDLMTAQRDADTLLYHLDPMRLAEPRSKYPCSAPARLRIGPDWLAYAGNWLTEWERTGNSYYRNKIQTGLQSITELTDGIFTGNLAKGYDPATGRISYDGPADLRMTNHLFTIMGGFEVMNELLADKAMYNIFSATWLDFARRYKQMAWETRHHTFPVRRLEAYAAWQDRDPQRTAMVWDALWNVADHGLKQAKKTVAVLPPDAPAALDELPGLSTNNASMWSLDAIYMLEVLDK
ncbi:MAG: DUF6250 domain-containing protein [Prevotella sp.]|nr:DUF6250 domain-containing protein [Prevotella sp.]